MSRYVCRECLADVGCRFDDGTGPRIDWEDAPTGCPYHVGTPRWELEG